MGACDTCGNNIVDAANFCPSCGAAVGSRASAPPSDAVIVPSRDRADPLAATAPADPSEIAKLRRELEGARNAAKKNETEARSRGGTEPMPARLPEKAESLPTLQSGPPLRVAPTYPHPASPVSSVAVGTRVQVVWADGQRYPGTVQRSEQGQVLVLFSDGQPRWVDVRWVTVA